MSKGSDAMRDVHAKLDWAERHLADLMRLAQAYLKPGGGHQRPLGLAIDNGSPPLVIVRFTIDKPPPIDISLHAGDLIHNTRSALDHILARLKESFGGDPGRGSFPMWTTQNLWDERITNAKRSSLDGLDPAAVMLIYAEQPLHRAQPTEDPLSALNGLDNDDKHRLLHHGFAYPAVEQGVDLIQVRDRKMLIGEAENLWVTGQPLTDGTVLARYRVRGLARGLLRADPAAEIKLSTGPLDAPRTTYEEIIARVRDVARNATKLIDSHS